MTRRAQGSLLGFIASREVLLIGIAAQLLVASILPAQAIPTKSPPGTATAKSTPTTRARYDAEIRWTSYGIPHVKATDWGGLGYGFAYATATDAVCTMARDVVMVNGDLSRYFGPADGNRESDVFHRALLSSAAVGQFTRGQSANSNHFASGYVAGYNRYLRDHKTTLPAACNNAEWVRPLTSDDVTRLTIGVGIRYGIARYQRAIANAAPPGTKVSNLNFDFALSDGIGSNAVAMGKGVTASGRGLLLGNPHYPWQGSSRFHLIHTTIPGELDVMGVSLYTTSRVAIGFNKDIAWSHTVSSGTRASIYALELNPQDSTSYRYGAGYRPMTKVQVQVPVKGDNGAITTESRTVYFSHYGPIVVTNGFPWNHTSAFAVRDVNINNDRGAATYDALNRARNIDDVEAAISLQGIAWTNTIAADKDGTAFYADISVVPNLDADFIKRCQPGTGTSPLGVVVLNGADPTCEWKTDARSAIPGAMPPQLMPRLRRDDFVTNSNDSYWLTNPAAPLEGYSPIIGAERTFRGLRTRAGLSFIAEALKSGNKVTPETLQDMLFSQRHYGAETFLNDVLALCKEPIAPVVLTTGTVDITPSCKALAAWNRKETAESRGAAVWREFWNLAARVRLQNGYRVPFNAADPVNTPRGLAVETPAVRDGLRSALAQAQQRLAANNIAPDATLGSIQFEEKNGERIPIPGGDGGAGMWSVITADLKPNGYTPILAGNSYIQLVGWTADGRVDPRAVLSYSQSDDPASPHFADFTKLYSKGELVHLPFYEKDIVADKNLKTLRIKE